METEAITHEAYLQNILRRGFKIIRYDVNLLQIEMKNKGKHGWTIIERPQTLKQLNDRVLSLGAEEKTLIFNE